MTLRPRPSRRLIPLVVGTLAAIACPQLSKAKCRAVDFDPKKIQTILKELDSSKENLAALMDRLPANIPAFDVAKLMSAAEIIKGEGKMVAVFVSVLIIHAEMNTPADRKTVDYFVGVNATWIFRDLRSEGDVLTQEASDNGIRWYGTDEIENGRDHVRDLQELFSCAADNK